MKVVRVKHHSENGRKLVSVLLRDGEICILEKQDFDELIRLGVPATWRFFLGNVIVSLNKKNVQIARLLLDLDRGRSIKYLNGNRLDLRRSNLIVTNGKSKVRDRSLLPHRYNNKQCELKHEYEANPYA